MDDAYITRVATKWFWDKETAVTAWGPLHNVINMCHYNRPYKRATLGEYSFADVYLKSAWSLLNYWPFLDFLNGSLDDSINLRRFWEMDSIFWSG